MCTTPSDRKVRGLFHLKGPDMKKSLLILILASLVACGGGDPEPEAEPDVPPPKTGCNVIPRPVYCL